MQGSAAAASGTAERRVRSNGVLLTADADAVAAPDWIERNCNAIAIGADLVCGRVVLHPLEAALIPTFMPTMRWNAG